MIVRRRPPALTPDEFEWLPDHQGYELIDGDLREKAMGAETSEIQCELSFLLKLWLRSNPLGRVYESECMYRCFPRTPDRVRKPDVSFLRRERVPGGRSPVGVFTVRPDFVVEVLSPGDTVFDVEDKLADYHSAGIPLIWVVSPNTRKVRVYRLGEPDVEFTDRDELTGVPVLPGFRVKVADLFPAPDLVPVAVPGDQP
ncbi:MAG: Uma2 family endonuclease [Fimbriiglobus sp.]